MHMAASAFVKKKRKLSHNYFCTGITEWRMADRSNHFCDATNFHEVAAVTSASFQSSLFIIHAFPLQWESISSALRNAVSYNTLVRFHTMPHKLVSCRLIKLPPCQNLCQKCFSNKTTARSNENVEGKVCDSKLCEAWPLRILQVHCQWTVIKPKRAIQSQLIL